MHNFPFDITTSSVPSELCARSWNEKTSTNSSCDYILCSVNTINGLGRATSTLPCESCPQDGDSPYFGGTYCGEDLQRSILDELYRTTSGEEWINAAGWSSGESICSRYGVTCNSKGQVQSIDLHGNNLAGPVSSRIWLITTLVCTRKRDQPVFPMILVRLFLMFVQSSGFLLYKVKLDLSDNRVDVSFQQIGNARSLAELHLSQTNIASMESIGRAKSLETLDLANNGLSGPLTNEIFNLTQLKLLYLDYNEFTGTLPTLIGTLTNLEVSAIGAKAQQWYSTILTLCIYT